MKKVALIGVLSLAMVACVGGLLLPSTETALDDLEVGLCDAALDLSAPVFPGGPALAAFACPATAGLLKMGLDRVTALPDGGTSLTSTGTGTPSAASVLPVRIKMIRDSRGLYAVLHRGRFLGWVPKAQAVALNSPAGQIVLDQAAKDLATAAEIKSVNAAITPEPPAPIVDAGQTMVPIVDAGPDAPEPSPGPAVRARPATVRPQPAKVKAPAK